MNNLIKFTDWAAKRGYGKIRVPIEVMELFVEYLDYLECDVENLDISIVNNSLPIRYCQQCGNPIRRKKHKTWREHYTQ